MDRYCRQQNQYYMFIHFSEQRTLITSLLALNRYHFVCLCNHWSRVSSWRRFMFQPSHHHGGRPVMLHAASVHCLVLIFLKCSHRVPQHCESTDSRPSSSEEWRTAIWVLLTWITKDLCCCVVLLKSGLINSYKYHRSLNIYLPLCQRSKVTKEASCGHKYKCYSRFH